MQLMRTNTHKIFYYHGINGEMCAWILLPLQNT